MRNIENQTYFFIHCGWLIKIPKEIMLEKAANLPKEFKSAILSILTRSPRSMRSVTPVYPLMNKSANNIITLLIAIVFKIKLTRFSELQYW